MKKEQIFKPNVSSSNKLDSIIEKVESSVIKPTKRKVKLKLISSCGCGGNHYDWIEREVDYDSSYENGDSTKELLDTDSFL